MNVIIVANIIFLFVSVTVDVYQIQNLSETYFIKYFRSLVVQVLFKDGLPL